MKFTNVNTIIIQQATTSSYTEDNKNVQITREDKDTDASADNDES